jgi:hypothetical protein
MARNDSRVMELGAAHEILYLDRQFRSHVNSVVVAACAQFLKIGHQTSKASKLKAAGNLKRSGVRLRSNQQRLDAFAFVGHPPLIKSSRS